MSFRTRTATRVAVAALGLAVLSGLAACATTVSSEGHPEAGSTSHTTTSSAPVAPAGESCPPGVQDAAAQGIKDFGMYGAVKISSASASDTPLGPVAQNLSAALCILGFVGTNGAATPESGTVAFLPAAGKDALISALRNAGYENMLDEYTYTLGGAITSSDVANVTITPPDNWSVDFTPLFSEPILVVTTTKS